MRRLLSVLLALSCLAGAPAQEIRRAIPVQPLAPGQQSAPAAPQPAPATPLPPLAQDDLARFLAGQPTESLADLQRSGIYGDYVNGLAKLWTRFYQNYFTKMRDWSANELSPRLDMRRPVIYFFGGPDAINPLALYPNAPVYVLGGLEPVGSIADPRTLAPQALQEALDNLNKSLEVILSFGFFITKDMKGDLDRTAFRGVLPVISAFIVLDGGQIVSSSPFAVRGDGSMGDSGKGGLPGIKIQFRQGADRPIQTLYYVQANVSDDSMKKDGPLLKWASAFGTGNAYLKAASYLTHETYFSRIRNYLLSQASVLQDDSGIPFHYFREQGWRCWFFGTYSGTLDIFKKYYQPDLQTAFASPGTAAPLPFGTGYKWRQGQSNLLLAVRQEAPKALPAQ